MSIPNGQPTYVPAGRYLCTVQSDPVQRASTFGEGKFYVEIALQIQDGKGQWFQWPLATTLKSPRYHEILQVCGGQLLPNGVTQAPELLVGKKFVAKIGERLSRDKTHVVNELLEVSPYVPKTKATPLAVPDVPDEPAAEPLLNDEEEEAIPF